MGLAVLHDGKRFRKVTFSSKAAFKAVVRHNAGLLFGSSSLYVNLTGNLKCASGSSIEVDGLLFDLTKPEEPDLYLIAIEMVTPLSLPQVLSNVTKIIPFLKNPVMRSQLLDTIRVQLRKDRQLTLDITAAGQARAVVNYLRQSSASPTVLLIVDQLTHELSGIGDAYTEWSELVEIFSLDEYRCGRDRILLLSPSFDADQPARSEGMQEVTHGKDFEELNPTGAPMKKPMSPRKQQDTMVSDHNAFHLGSQAEPISAANESACPFCGSRMETLSLAPFVTACSNPRCSNSRPPFD